MMTVIETTTTMTVAMLVVGFAIPESCTMLRIDEHTHTHIHIAHQASAEHANMMGALFDGVHACEFS